MKKIPRITHYCNTDKYDVHDGAKRKEWEEDAVVLAPPLI